MPPNCAENFCAFSSERDPTAPIVWPESRVRSFAKARAIPPGPKIPQLNLSEPELLIAQLRHHLDRFGETIF